MEGVFIHLLNMSISAGWLILAVLVLRLLLRKAPRWIFVMLWGIVAIRLILPVTIESPLSLQPGNILITKEVPQEDQSSELMDIIAYTAEGALYEDSSEVPVNIDALEVTGNEETDEAATNDVYPVWVVNADDSVLTETTEVKEEKTITDPKDHNKVESVNIRQSLIRIGSIIWMIGICVLVLYAIISVCILKYRVRESIPYGESCRICDHVRSPFILGLICPVIYLPSGMGEGEIGYVLAHEHAHLKRGDHLWKALAFMLLTMYCFNPLIWLAYILLSRDIEMACDEKAIRDMDMQDKKAYANALVSFSTERRPVIACPLAFGEVGVKERVKGILNYKKPGFWFVVLAVIACIVVAVCFLTDPKKTETMEEEPQGPVNVVVKDDVGDGKDTDEHDNAGSLSNDEADTSDYKLITFRYRDHPCVFTYGDEEYAYRNYTTISTETYEYDEDIHEYFALKNRLLAFNEEQKEKILGNDGILELAELAESDTGSGRIKNEHWEVDPYEWKYLREMIPIRADSEVFSFVVFSQQYSIAPTGLIEWLHYNIDPLSGEDIRFADVVTDTEALTDIIFDKLETINESLASESTIGYMHVADRYIINRSGDFMADEYIYKIPVEEEDRNEMKERLERYQCWALDYDGVWFFFSGNQHKAYGVKIRYKDHPEIFSAHYFLSNPDGDVAFQAIKYKDADTKYIDLMRPEEGTAHSESLTLSDYQAELDKINEELGTNYSFPTEDLLKAEGRTLKDVEEFFQQMTLEEFRDYIIDISQVGWNNPIPIDPPIEHEYSVEKAD